MNEKEYIDVLNRHGVPVPPSWGGMIGSGSEQMFSLGGRWLKAGQRSPQGHTIDSFDPKTGFLNLSYQGVPLMPLKMRNSVVQDYKPEFIKQFNSNPYADTEHEKDFERLKAAGASEEQIQGILNPEKYQGFTPSMMEKIRKNMYDNKKLDYENNGIVSFEEYQNAVTSGKAKEGVYVVPYQTNDGGVDLQDFYFEGYTPNKNPAQSYLQDPSVQLFGDDGLIK
jgi:hypothetical protein